MNKKKVVKKGKGNIRKTLVIKLLPTDKQLDAINEAIDFIGANSDGAADYKYYSGLSRRLRSVWNKGINLKNLVSNVIDLNSLLPYRQAVFRQKKRSKANYPLRYKGA